MQKAVPLHEWRKRQVPCSSEAGRDTVAGSATATDNDDTTTGQETGPAEARVAHIFLRRVIQPELCNAVAESVRDEDGTPDMGVESGSVCREEQSNALSDFEGNSSPDESEVSLAPDAEQACAGGAGARPLRKLKLTWRSRAFRMALYTGSNCTASACTIEGCGRLPRIQYTDRHTKALTEVCCLHCCYNARDVDDVKVHTPECDTLQRKHDDEVDAALEPAPGAHRTNDISAAMWFRPWWWATRPGASPQWRNRHLTDTEQSITSSFPEVKGDGAMRMEDTEFNDAFKLTLRPFDLDDIDHLRVHPTMVEVLNDFIFYAVHRHVSSSDELYGDPTPELRLDVERSREMLQVALRIQEGKAGLNLLERYGYQGPWGAHDPGTTTTDPVLALLEVGIEPGPDIIEDTCARTYIGRSVIPTTDAQAHAAGLTIETAGNLSSYLLLKAKEFV